MTKPAQNFLLCSKCRANISVVETDGDVQELVIRIRAARKDAAFPINTNRQAVTKGIRAAIGPYQLERKIANVKGGMRKRMVDMFVDTFRQYKAHKWDRYMTAQAMGIETKTLEERMRTYEKRGWVRKNGRGWKRTDKIAHAQF